MPGEAWCTATACHVDRWCHARADKLGIKEQLAHHMKLFTLQSLFGGTGRGRRMGAVMLEEEWHLGAPPHRQRFKHASRVEDSYGA